MNVNVFHRQKLILLVCNDGELTWAEVLFNNYNLLLKSKIDVSLLKEDKGVKPVLDPSLKSYYLPLLSKVKDAEVKTVKLSMDSKKKKNSEIMKYFESSSTNSVKNDTKNSPITSKNQNNQILQHLNKMPKVSPEKSINSNPIATKSRFQESSVESQTVQTNPFPQPSFISSNPKSNLNHSSNSNSFSEIKGNPNSVVGHDNNKNNSQGGGMSINSCGANDHGPNLGKMEIEDETTDNPTRIERMETETHESENIENIVNIGTESNTFSPAESSDLMKLSGSVAFTCPNEVTKLIEEMRKYNLLAVGAYRTSTLIDKKKEIDFVLEYTDKSSCLSNLALNKDFPYKLIPGEIRPYFEVIHLKGWRFTVSSTYQNVSEDFKNASNHEKQQLLQYYYAHQATKQKLSLPLSTAILLMKYNYTYDKRHWRHFKSSDLVLLMTPKNGKEPKSVPEAIHRLFQQISSGALLKRNSPGILEKETGYDIRNRFHLEEFREDLEKVFKESSDMLLNIDKGQWSKVFECKF